MKVCLLGMVISYFIGNHTDERRAKQKKIAEKYNVTIKHEDIKIADKTTITISENQFGVSEPTLEM